jgi:hypothetical protein
MVAVTTPCVPLGWPCGIGMRMKLAEAFESGGTTNEPAPVVNMTALGPVFEAVRAANAVNLGPVFEAVRAANAANAAKLAPFFETIRAANAANLEPAFDAVRAAAAFDFGRLTGALRFPSLDLAAADELLGCVQQTVAAQVEDDEVAGVPLTKIWMESLADLREWLSLSLSLAVDHGRFRAA